MMRSATHREWLLRHIVPSLLLSVIVVTWSAGIGVYTYRMLGVTLSSVNGRPPTIADELLIRGLGPASGTFQINVVVLVAIFVLKIRFRWWLAAGLLVVIGTPAALVAGWQIAEYLWALNKGGTPWEEVLPAPLGLCIAWVALVPAEMALDRITAFLRRRRDAVANPCPHCGYDLIGNESGVCPECGGAGRMESA